MDQDQHPHGTPKRYRAGCKCQPCRAAWATYCREQRAGISHRKPAAGRQLAAAGSSRAGATEQLADEAARLAELWAAEAPAAKWRADLEGAAGHDCPECGGPLYWAGAHTVLLCPRRHDDGQARRHVSPEASARETAHAEARAQRQAPAAELARRAGPSDAEAIELARRKGGLTGQLGQLASGNLTPGEQGVVAWFRHEVDAADSDARLDELVELFGEAGIRVKRGLWPGRARLVLDGGEYDVFDGDEYPEADGGEYPDAAEADTDTDAAPLARLAAIANDPAASECGYCEAAGRPGIAAAWVVHEPGGALMPACPHHYRWARGQYGATMLAAAVAPTPRAIAAGPATGLTSTLCELCYGQGAQSPAVARVVSPQAPWLAPERDVCQRHYAEIAATVLRMTYVNLEILKRYGNAPGVRSIIKVAS